METLTQIAKRLGIKPNPNITDEEFMQIDNQIRTELRRIAPDYEIKDNKYNGGFYTENELYDVIYTLRKSHPLKQAHKFNKLLLDRNIKKIEQVPTSNGVDVFWQSVFCFHSATPIGQHSAERFQVDIKLDDINIPSVFTELDSFILKYKSSYKIYPKEDRTDTLNVYMTTPITPKIAKEFYEIVKDVLNDKNHALLDGYPITMDGKEIQGIKFAPESHTTNNEGGETALERRKRFSRLFQGQNIIKMRNLLVRPAPSSVGYLAAKAQECDLIYYLIGREGQNPIQLGNQFGEPGKTYTKTSLDISDKTNNHSLFVKGILKKISGYTSKS